MPSDAAGATPLLPPDPTPAGPRGSPAFALARACATCPGAEHAAQLARASRALWMATLSLMTAFMQNQAPAHRLLLARRISRNFDTLSRQDCFDSACRASFARLAGRWQARSEQITPEGETARTGPLRLLS